MHIITVTGNLGKDAENRTTQGGDTVCSFSVASKQGYGDRATTNWFRCSVWGKRAQSLGPYLLKGQQVTVSGELEVEDYQGKTQLNIRVNDVALQGQRGGGSQGGRDGGSSDPGNMHGGGWGEDALDDSVPFATCDWTADLNWKRVL